MARRDCLEPEQRRCLIALSDGGEDATTVREFDLATGQFVPGGFTLPHGKQSVAWEDADHILVSREWEPGDVTTSGYPFIVKRVTRGAPLSAAVEVFRGTKADTEIHADDVRRRRRPPADDHRPGARLLPLRKAPRRSSRHALLGLPPKSAIIGLVAGRAVVRLDEAWHQGTATLPAGSLAAFDLAATERTPADPRPTLIWTPGPRDALESADTTKDRLLVATLDNVRGRAWSFDPTASGWTKTRLDVPDNLAIAVGDTDLRSNRAFVTTSGFLNPPTSCRWSTRRRRR